MQKYVKHVARRIYYLLFESEYLQEKQHLFTLISRKVVEKNVHATIKKGNMGYDQYAVPELKTTHNTFRDCRVHFFRQPFSK